jgi:putative oxidoreductase
MTSVALFLLRATIGGFLAGHGAQKLFGMFGGHGMEGTAGFLESLNLRPGRQWAAMAGLSEFLGGGLTALGLLNPIGPIMATGSMLMATVKVHLGKPVWASSGGAELPITNMAALGALSVAGPGRISLDTILGIRVPRWFSLLVLGAMGASVYMAATTTGTAEELAGQPGTDEVEAGGELEAGEGERLQGNAGESNARPGIESWGSPDGSETPEAVEDESGSIAAMRTGEE